MQKQESKVRRFWRAFIGNCMNYWDSFAGGGRCTEVFNPVSPIEGVEVFKKGEGGLPSYVEFGPE